VERFPLVSAAFINGDETVLKACATSSCIIGKQHATRHT